MIRLLPVILIIILILGGLGYWRFIYSQSNTIELQTAQQNLLDSPTEVPKTLPQTTFEDRIKTLEDVVSKLVSQVNSLKSPATQTQPNASVDSTINALNTSITELKIRVSVLEKVTPASSVSQSTQYIPLGSGGYWENSDWFTTTEYQISLNPDNYPGYSAMNLEVTFRIIDSLDIGSVRLYNVTDSSTTLSQVDTSSSSFVLVSSSSFKLATGTKTYKLQVKSTQGKGLFIQSARIKVTF